MKDEKFDKFNISVLCDLYGALLTDKQCDMLRLFYDFDNSLGEISEQYGITRQAVHDSINKGEESLFGFEEKLHFLAKLESIKSQTKDIVSNATQPQIKQIANNILKELGE